MSKSFSPAGMTVKGYYGLGARTFGNPDGALTGGGAYAAGGDNPNGPNQGGGSHGVPQFARVDGGTFDPADQLIDLLMAGVHVIASGDSTNVIGVSSDSGATWTRVVVPGVGSLSIRAGRPDGTFVANTDSPGVILTSTDGGLTWTDTSPSATVGAFVFYSVTFGLFYVPDTGTAQFWTSPDGITWTAQPVATVGFDNEHSLEVAGVTVGLGLPPGGGSDECEIWRTTDGTSWTRVQQLAQSNAVFVSPATAVAASPTEFYALFSQTPTDIVQLYRSLDAGLTWALVSSSTDEGVPPFSATLVLYKGEVVSAAGAGGAGNLLARTLNGVGFTVNSINSTDFGQLFSCTTSADGATLYGWGGGIVSTTNYPQFGTALPLSVTGFVDAMVTGPGFALACGTDNNSLPAIWRVS